MNEEKDNGSVRVVDDEDNWGREQSKSGNSRLECQLVYMYAEHTALTEKIV